VNQIALKTGITAVYGSVVTRGAGGDVLRVRPNGPCYTCVYTESFNHSFEVSSMKQIKKTAPSYRDNDELLSTIQVGLSSDVIPIANMVVKMALLELTRGKDCALNSLAEDLRCDYYRWTNRREGDFESFPIMEGCINLSILRWYPVETEKNPDCLVCAASSLSTETQKQFFG